MKLFTSCLVCGLLISQSTQIIASRPIELEDLVKDLDTLVEEIELQEELESSEDNSFTAAFGSYGYNGGSYGYYGFYGNTGGSYGEI